MLVPPPNEEGPVNWKLIFQLSLFGLAMGIGTVFIIPSTIEPFFWLVIFLISAYFIAKRCANRYFLHGVALGLANSIWVTGSHVLLFRQYVANHPREAAMMSSMPLPTHPRVMQLIMGPIIGLVSGIIIGLLALLARRLFVSRLRPAVSEG
jgi:hypothetical protein